MEEHLYRVSPGAPRNEILHARRGRGWWWSGEEGREVPLQQEPTACALAAAAADASFEAREVAEFIRRWGFFDPSPFLLRRDWGGLESERFDSHGRNLARTLHALERSSPETFESVVAATRSVLGLPSDIEPRESDNGFPDNATTVLAREDPDGIRRALDESGFGLGEYYETRGFGAQ